MSKKQKRILWPALLIVAFGASALGFVRGRGPNRVEGREKPSVDSRKALSSASTNVGSYVRRAFLRPQLIPNLLALGDRLERPGKERLTISGTLNWSGDSQPGHVVAILEFPDKLRLTLAKGVQTKVITFDGQRAATVTGGSLDSKDLDLLEALIYDAADHLFATQMQGQATRVLGARFRMDDGTASDYRGPYYDIYQVADLIRTSSQIERRPKLYYFNSQTLLLELVRYGKNRNGALVSIETSIGDWQSQQGQKVVRRIERKENGKSVFVLTISSAAFSRYLDDGIF